MVLRSANSAVVFFIVFVVFGPGIVQADEPKLTQFPTLEANTEGRLPVGFTMSVIDISCKEVINSIPIRLEVLGLMFVWTNQDAGILTVGPITQKLEPGDLYTTLRKTYLLKIVCYDELSTDITGEILLEGLKPNGQWIGITDSKTIEQHSLEFFQKLDL